MAFPLDPGPRAMLPLVPAKEQQNHDVLQHAGLGHGQHDNDINMNLEDMLPLQQVFDLDQQAAMLEDGNSQLREQVMSPRERGQQQQVNAVQDRQFAFGNLPANVVAENRRQENREYHDGGNVFLQQNILQQVNSTSPAATSIGNDSGKPKRCHAPTCPRGPSGPTRVKEIENAMVHALQTVDMNHAAHDQGIQAQAQGLQRLTARQDAQESAIQAVLEAQSELHASMLAQERESETRKARFGVLERFTSEHLNDAMLRLPAKKICTKD